MITNYEITLYLFSVFLTVYGVLFLFFSANIPAPKNASKLRSVVNIPFALFIFGLLYLGLTHFTIYSALAINVDTGRLPICENVVANSTVNALNPNIVSYEYTNSCAGQTVHPVMQEIFTVFTWVLWLDIFALIIGFMMIGLIKIYAEW